MIRRYFLRFKTILVASLALLAIAFASGGKENVAHAHFHTAAERAHLIAIMQAQPYDTNTFFATGGRCSGCHGHDPQHIAFYTHDSVDVNIGDDWAGTMMANSAKDPLWRAKVSHEIMVNPALQTSIENKCTACHAPTGHFEAILLGEANYTMSSLNMPLDSFGRDGVNCSACHAQRDTLLGHNFTGNLQYDTTKTEYGPYMNPYYAPMEFFVGFTPVGSPHVKSGQFCGGCHTLITQSVDLSGNPTGRSFFEQSTFHEWENSSYSTNNITCQHCHIPEIFEPIHIATDYPYVAPRDTFGEHHLIGGNAFMLKLMRNNMSTIGATCQPYNFDTTIARTTRYLYDSTLIMNLNETAQGNDTAFYDVQLISRVGHKFPSGYPSRLAWVQFIATNNVGDTIFSSGLTDVNGDIIGRDLPFEPHHNIISDGTNDVQIYEMVMGDVNHNATTVLERADTVLKDNRIPPNGFLSTHPSYDTMRVYGTNGDPDFNRNGANEGTGSDIVHYHVKLNGYTGPLFVTAKVWYYSVPRRWVGEMFTLSSPDIDAFHNMYNAADQSPLLVAQSQYTSIILSANNPAGLSPIGIFPNPTADGRVQISGWNRNDLVDVRVFDVNGKEVIPPVAGSLFNGTLLLPSKGVYLVAIETKKGRVVKRVMWM